MAIGDETSDLDVFATTWPMTTERWKILIHDPNTLMSIRRKKNIYQNAKKLEKGEKINVDKK
uniref:Uncharacterized protein n=1 Tax=Romanomermis culicivorax TaxID=13658 RepID=A0A915JSG6_ROMCU